MTAFFHTHSSSSSTNSDFRGSLHIGQDIDFASSPGGTTTNSERNLASRSASSASAVALALSTLEPSARPFPSPSQRFLHLSPPPRRRTSHKRLRQLIPRHRLRTYQEEPNLPPPDLFRWERKSWESWALAVQFAIIIARDASRTSPSLN